MRVRTRNFDWRLYEEPIKEKLYRKAKNHTDLTAIFSSQEINPNFIML